MAQEEIMKIKAEIFDIISKQEEYVATAKIIQQTRDQKIQYLRDVENKSSPDEIIKLKAEIFDIMLKQEEYVSATNALQQTKAQKLQQLSDAQKSQQSQNIPKQPDIKQ